MMFDFDEFTEAVFQAYRDKKERNELPTELEKPRRAVLRDYCLQKWIASPLDKDREVVSAFFSDRAGDEIEASIGRVDVDRFRPLINYLNGETANTHENNIKLLAWLIDFEPRPYRVWREMKGQIPPTPLPPDSTPTDNHPPEEGFKGDDDAKTEQTTIGTPPITYPPIVTQPPKRIQKWLVWLVPVMAILWGILFFSMGRWTKQCMYWDGDHYVAIRCEGAPLIGTERVAIDRNELEHFRKITRPDTLTSKDINKVWYSKINNSVEFFTAPGFHPIHRERALKVASKHMIEQYAGDSESVRVGYE